MRDVWVIGAGLPMGGRVMGPPDDGKLWIDVCMVGTHLPQQYREEDAYALTPDKCGPLGLCPGCLGFGTIIEGQSMVGVTADVNPAPCVTCHGSGRPYLMAHVRRQSDAVEIWQEIKPHTCLPPVTGCFEVCPACGNDEEDEKH